MGCLSVKQNVKEVEIKQNGNSPDNKAKNT
jgi:hypothetical protein